MILFSKFTFFDKFDEIKRGKSIRICVRNRNSTGEQIFPLQKFLSFVTITNNPTTDGRKRESEEATLTVIPTLKKSDHQKI